VCAPSGRRWRVDSDDVLAKADAKTHLIGQVIAIAFTSDVLMFDFDGFAADNLRRRGCKRQQVPVALRVRGISARKYSQQQEQRKHSSARHGSLRMRGASLHLLKGSLGVNTESPICETCAKSMGQDQGEHIK